MKFIRISVKKIPPYHLAWDNKAVLLYKSLTCNFYEFDGIIVFVLLSFILIFIIIYGIYIIVKVRGYNGIRFFGLAWNFA